MKTQTAQLLWPQQHKVGVKYSLTPQEHYRFVNKRQLNQPLLIMIHNNYIKKKWKHFQMHRNKKLEHKKSSIKF